MYNKIASIFFFEFYCIIYVVQRHKKSVKLQKLTAALTAVLTSHDMMVAHSTTDPFEQLANIPLLASFLPSSRVDRYDTAQLPKRW